MKLILEFDDLNPKKEVNCIDQIDYLVKLFPNIKLTFFTTALYERVPLFSDQKWCHRIMTHIANGNVRLAVHGLYHTQEEFKHKSWEDAMLSLKMAEDVFEIARLPFIKVFRGPHWGINEATYTALMNLDYEAVYTHEDYKNLIPKFSIKSIIYNWNLKDEDCTEQNLIIGHGHTQNVCGNGIEESMQRIINFINKHNPEFAFANDKSLIYALE